MRQGMHMFLMGSVAAQLVACGLWVGNPKPKDNPPVQGFIALPLITPPVKLATPLGLQDGSGLRLTLPADEFRNRFFTEGPTSVFALLEGIDNSINGFNKRAADSKYACIDQEPVAYSLAPFGQDVTFYAQCFEQFAEATAENPAFTQFGRHDGKFYLYYAAGQQHSAIIVTPLEDSVDGYLVQAWMGIGYLNAASCGAFDKCSYGVLQLEANSHTRFLELAVAGIGFGYCGAQLKSDATHIFAEGSQDQTACTEPDTLCVAGSDLSAATDCSAVEEFSLPALGREASAGEREHGASQYPHVPNVVLDGTVDDSLNFGPLVPTPGVGEFR